VSLAPRIAPIACGEIREQNPVPLRYFSRDRENAFISPKDGKGRNFEELDRYSLSITH
jgi:hypothetical protein